MQALILTDVQHDFLPGGALGIKGADAILPLINKLLPQFDHVLATQDWHPPHHVSFASTHHKKVGEVIHISGVDQILWPDHCIQNSWGAALSSKLDLSRIEKIFHKGTDPKIDSYSAFFDNARHKSTGLEAYLRKHHLDELHFVGLATDYCVLYSVLDALDLGFKVKVLRDACKAINRLPQDEQAALALMHQNGAQIIHS